MIFLTLMPPQSVKAGEWRSSQKKWMPLAFAEQVAKENEAEPYKRFSVTETSDAFASGEKILPFGTISVMNITMTMTEWYTFATREEAGEYLEQVEKETDRQEAAEWAYVERAKSVSDGQIQKGSCRKAADRRRYTESGYDWQGIFCGFPDYCIWL